MYNIFNANWFHSSLCHRWFDQPFDAMCFVASRVHHVAKRKLQFEETCSIVIIGLTSQWKGPNWIRGPVVALCSLAHPTEVAGCARTGERSTWSCRLGESASPEWPRWPRRPSKIVRVHAHLLGQIIFLRGFCLSDSSQQFISLGVLVA